MNKYESPPHRHEHDFRKIGELFARVQDFLAKPELAIYSQHTVNPPYTLITLADKDYPVVVIIDSAAIASTQQILFDTLWQLL